MKQTKYKVLALLLAAVLMLFTVSGCSLFAKSDTNASLSDISAEMYQADWWISKAKKADKVLLSEDGIQELNSTVASALDTPAVDFTNYSHRISAAQLEKLIQPDRFSEKTLYNSLGDPLEASFMDDLQKTMNLDSIGNEVVIRFAVLAKDAKLRTYPVLTAAYESDEANSADVFDSGSLRAGTPVAVLHSDSAESWFFVQSESNIGWISADALALTDNADWNEYISAKSYLVVTGVSVMPESAVSNTVLGQALSMGTRLPLCTEEEKAAFVGGRSTAGCYVVKFPLQNRFGESEFTALLIPYSEDVHVGYLPYTQENLLQQAAKFAGRSSSVVGTDGAYMMESIFSVFGIQLPGTLSQQASLHLNDTALDNLSASERTKTLGSLSCGTLLFMPERVALVLGTVKGRTYVLTTLRDYYEDDERVAVNASVITTLNLAKRDGTTLKQTLTSAKSLLLETAEEAEKQTSAVSSSGASSSSVSSSAAQTTKSAE